MKGIENVKVRDVMTRGVITVQMDAPVRDAAEILVDEDIEGVGVTAPNGEIMGIISEIDIVKAFDENWDKLTAEDIMSSFVKTIDPEDTLKHAAETMKKEKIHRLIVLSSAHIGASDRPIGILCASDIIKAAVGKR
ncbi:MAG: hypothetical protein A7316_01440 [Candidatus Altiarchaeales archaeon WOR_SM1_86-2]|nr:MAG: hypothetical protein A7315_13110 [Candidatus Altiarchaeales archaeon WOR_SM1_79]ODS37980.1 MAG: hypothetical protein A7316_01440 [Candidatus Altiarchaeales archaeon WOR_SM1_86-2]